MMFHSWCQDVGKYVFSDNLQHYGDLTNQDGHQATTIMFIVWQIPFSDCKLMLTHLLRPISWSGVFFGSNAAQPVQAMIDFLEAYQQHKQTRTYRHTMGKARQQNQDCANVVKNVTDAQIGTNSSFE